MKEVCVLKKVIMINTDALSGIGENDGVLRYNVPFHSLILVVEGMYPMKFHESIILKTLNFLLDNRK